MELMKFKTFIARCLFKFFIDGNLKAYGVVLEQTVRESSTSYTIVGWSSTVQVGICYMISPFAGFLEKQLSYPRLALVGAIAVVIGSIVQAITLSMWQLFIAVFTSGCGFGLLNIATILALKDTFRGSYDVAYSITQLATYAGVSILPPVLDYFRRMFDREIAMLMFGGLSLSLLTVFVLVPGEQEKLDSEVSGNNDASEDGLREELRLLEVAEDEQERENEEVTSPITESDEEQGGTAKSLFVEHPGIIMLVFLDSIFRLGFTSWAIYLVPYGEYSGLESSTAVLLSTIGGIGGICGRLFGIVLCHFGVSNIITGLSIPSALIALAYAFSLFYNDFVVLSIVGFIGGFGFALEGNTTVTMVASVVCDNHFKSAIVFLFTAAGIGSQLGGLLVGAILDFTGSYMIAFGALSSIMAIQCFGSILWYLCCNPTKSRKL